MYNYTCRIFIMANYLFITQYSESRKPYPCHYHHQLRQNSHGRIFIKYKFVSTCIYNKCNITLADCSSLVACVILHHTWSLSCVTLLHKQMLFEQFMSIVFCMYVWTFQNTIAVLARQASSNLTIVLCLHIDCLFWTNVFYGSCWLCR